MGLPNPNSLHSSEVGICYCRYVSLWAAGALPRLAPPLGASDAGTGRVAVDNVRYGLVSHGSVALSLIV